MRETTKATNIPKSVIQSSKAVNPNPNFIILIALSPNITGTARKKVNSAAATRETPIRRAPIIVEPDRDVPGIIESTWNKPIKNAVIYVISLIVSILGLRFLLKISIRINAIPYKIKAEAITSGV